MRVPSPPLPLSLAIPLSLALSLSIVLSSSVASAWWVSDPLHKDCHERIAHAALQQVGYVAPPPALSKADAALRKGVQFDATRYDANIYALSLVMGARWPDAQGAPSFDFYKLSRVHNAPGDQGSHCLRAESDVGSDEGDRRALAACRDRISALYWGALETLDATSGSVDPDRRTIAPEYLPFLGKTDVPLSGFYFDAGRALHAIQDSFTHAYRSAGTTDAGVGGPGRHLVHVFNWSSQVRGNLREAQNGHGHESILDNCEDDNPSNADRLAWATEASADFLRALTTPGARPERQKRLDDFLEEWMSYQAGCSLANEYCDHPVQAWLRSSGKSMNYGSGGCAAGGGADGAGWLAPLAALGALGMRRGRRVRRSALAGARGRALGGGAPAAIHRRALRGGVLLAATLALGVGAAGVARADDEHRGWHGEVRASMSVQNPAYGLGAAGAWAWRRGEIGGFAELNPWYDANREMMSMGSTNLGAFGHYLHAITPAVRLRAGLGLGLSVLNQELPGTSAGTVGLYANLRLLGIVWHFRDRLALTVDAFDLALPAPQLRGWPVMYAQSRFSVGLQF